MPSALAGIFREIELVFQVPGGYVTDPETGNLVPAEPTPVPIRCWLKVTRDPSIQTSVSIEVGEAGALSQFLTLRGRCVDPIRLPWYLHAGMEAPLRLRGQDGTFRLAPIPPALLPEVEDELGQAIAGVWESH